MKKSIQCPQCSELLKHTNIGDLSGLEGSSIRWSDVVFLCPQCNTVLGQAVNPETFEKLTEISAKPKRLTGHNSPHAGIKRHLDWPLLCSQKELAEIADLLHKGESIYPPQGKPVGEILIHYGIIDQKVLDMVRFIQQENPSIKKPIGETLVEKGIINQDTLNRALIIQAGIPPMKPCSSNHGCNAQRIQCTLPSARIHMSSSFLSVTPAKPF